MGGFFIVGPAERARAEALDGSFRAQGFAPARVIAHPNGDTWLYPRQSGGGALATEFGPDAFAAATGTLFYRGRAGVAALGDLGRDVLAGAVDWTGLHGSFALIVGAPHGLYVMTDPAGTYFVHRATDAPILSSSLLAALTCLEAPELLPQSVYEYVFAGSVFGGQTLFRDIELMDCRAATSLGVAGMALPAAPVADLDPKALPFEEAVEGCHGVLRDIFATLAGACGDRIDAALSGGYDSRLILALLLEQGVMPRLHVYGAQGDADVRVAQSIAAGEGIPLRHIDKSGLHPGRRAVEDIVARNYMAFDGCPTDGIFDDGADLASRLMTFDGGALALNGGGGEVFRNFIYLRDRPFSTEEFLRAFYFQFDPAVCAPSFRARDYLAEMAGKIRRTLGVGDRTLTRTEIEYLYPAFRGRYWMGRNNSVNHRLGAYATPFVDPNVAARALPAAIADKNFGRLEAAILRRAWPRLARYASSYGHDFASDPPSRRRFEDTLTLARPTLLRGWSYRVKYRLRGTAPAPLPPDALSRVMDPTFPYMGRYFHLNRMRDGAQLQRVWTLEYLCQRLSARTR